MKKRTILSFALILVMLLQSYAVLGAELYPKHSVAASKKAEINSVIAVVYAAMDEDTMTNIIRYVAAAENTDIYLYPIGADGLAPYLLKASKEGVETAFSKYIVTTTQTGLGYNTAEQALDKLNSMEGVQKTLYYMDRLMTRDSVVANIEMLMGGQENEYDAIEALFAKYPDIAKYNDTSYVVEGSNSDYPASFFDITKLGYDRCRSASYRQREGKLYIEAGKADHNMLIYATAQKSELLYISGYMATAQTVAKYAADKKIKGVSLGYNNVYIKKSSNPKNAAVALFTITDEVGDTATDAFELIIKNADSVEVYYKSTPGIGTSTAKTTYDKTQDDKIKNVDGEDTPSILSKSEAKDAMNELQSSLGISNSFDSLFEEKNEVPEGFMAKAWYYVKKVVSTIWGIVWLLIKILLFAFVVLMIVHKKFRGNVMAKVYASKYGPSVQRIYEKILDITNSLFVKTTRKVKGNASLQGKFAFISHASIDMKKNGSVVAALVAELEAQGVQCWTSENGIDGSEDYNYILPQAIKKCAMMILFLSPNSVASPEVESEVIAGKRERKTIFPVQICEFDLFGDDKWQHLLTQYQVKPLMTPSLAEVRKVASSIKNIYDNIS